MSQKRARRIQTSDSEDYCNDVPSFDFLHVRESHSVPGTSDRVLEVLRDMSTTHKRISTDGHIVHVTVNELYNWVMNQKTPEKFIHCFGEGVLFDAFSNVDMLMHLPKKLEMSEMIGAFFQQYLLYDRVYTSVNRLKIKILTGSELLRSLICFKNGTVAMKLAKAIPWIHDAEITEILFSDLPSKERSLFLETKIPFFVFSDLNSAEESEYIRINNRMD